MNSDDDEIQEEHANDQGMNNKSEGSRLTYTDMDQDIANNIDCSEEELNNNPQKCNVKKKEGSTTILVIFGGATLSLLLIYLILAFHKYVRE